MNRISFSTQELEHQISRRRNFLGPSLSTHYHKPILVKQGRGTFLIDVRDQAFLDFVNNPASLGHCHPHVVQAAAEQLGKLNTNTRYVYAELTDYAEKLTRLFPEKLHICFFVNSGSEANDLALRIARAHTKAQDFIVIEGAYHGHTEELVRISPYKFDGKGGFPQPANVWKVPIPDMFRGDHCNDADPAQSYALHVKKALDSMKASGRRPAAFVCEGMLSTAGYHPLPPRYLRQVYKFVHEAGGVCISDEVQSGFGRAGEGKMWGFELHDVIPDIVTMGKPMGNGFPLAAVITTKELASSFANGMEYFNTFGGSTAAMRVGQAVLEVMHFDDVLRNVDEVGRHLKEELNKLKEKYECIGDVRGSGLFLGLEFVRDKKFCLPAPGLATYVVEASRCKGLLLGSDGIHNNVLKIKPPLCLSREQADLMVTVLDEVLASAPDIDDEKLQDVARGLEEDLTALARVNNLVREFGYGAGKTWQEDKQRSGWKIKMAASQQFAFGVLVGLALAALISRCWCWCCRSCDQETQKSPDASVKHRTGTHFASTSSLLAQQTC